MAKSSRKLSLARETVRNLDVDALKLVGGGNYYAIWNTKCTRFASGCLHDTVQGGGWRPILPGGEG